MLAISINAVVRNIFFIMTVGLSDGIKVSQKSHLATHGFAWGELAVYPEVALVEV
jgi:hypothetical protein